MLFKMEVLGLEQMAKLHSASLTSLPQIKRVLVEPFLDILGFSASQPTDMEFDIETSNGVLDYVLYKDEVGIVGVFLQSESEYKQESSYPSESMVYEMIRSVDVSVAIVTDGVDYSFYTRSPHTESLELLYSFSLLRHLDIDILMLEALKEEFSNWVSVGRLITKYKIYDNILKRVFGDYKKFMRFAINGAKLTELEKESAISICQDLQELVKSSILDVPEENVFDYELDDTVLASTEDVDNTVTPTDEEAGRQLDIKLSDLTNIDMISNKVIRGIRIVGFEMEINFWRQLLMSAISYGINVLDMSPAQIVRSSPKSDWCLVLSQEAKEIKRGRIDYEGIAYSGHGGAWALLSKFKKTISAWGISFSDVVLTICDRKVE